MATESDRLLVERIRANDADAWEHLIERYEGRLFAFVHRRIKDAAGCEDIVQESFVGFFTSLPNYDERRELQTYLFTIASHKITDYLRRHGRHPLAKRLRRPRRRAATSGPTISPPPPASLAVTNARPSRAMPSPAAWANCSKPGATKPITAASR